MFVDHKLRNICNKYIHIRLLISVYLLPNLWHHYETCQYPFDHLYLAPITLCTYCVKFNITYMPGIKQRPSSGPVNVLTSCRSEIAIYWWSSSISPGLGSRRVCMFRLHHLALALHTLRRSDGVYNRKPFFSVSFLVRSVSFFHLLVQFIVFYVIYSRTVFYWLSLILPASLSDPYKKEG